MVSVALDAWTSSSGLPFLGIVVKWVSEHWKVTTVTIGFERLIGEHTGDNLAEALASVLSEFNLIDKVSKCTCNRRQTS